MKGASSLVDLVYFQNLDNDHLGMVEDLQADFHLAFRDWQSKPRFGIFGQEARLAR